MFKNHTNTPQLLSRNYGRFSWILCDVDVGDEAPPPGAEANGAVLYSIVQI